MQAIVAADNNWGIGYQNRLLVSIPSDMKFFRQKTTGNVVVMGRKTLESFPNGLPLKNRVNIVLTKNKNYQVKDAVIVHSIDELLEELKSYKEAEEQGLLVRLPCKVGDDVYIIPSPPIYGLNIFYGCENVNRVYHQHIESITFAGSHWYATGRNEYKEKVLNDTAFGTTWFLTREEAKKKLEEMKK